MRRADVYTLYMPALIKRLFGYDLHTLDRVRILISVCGILIMVALTVVTDVNYTSKPLQVRELAGREVSMEKLADVFLGMDQMSMENHYRRVWTYNAVIFLSALLLLRSLKDAGKK